jgi:hypothetical protein
VVIALNMIDVVRKSWTAIRKSYDALGAKWWRFRAKASGFPACRQEPRAANSSSSRVPFSFSAPWKSGFPNRELLRGVEKDRSVLTVPIF